MFLKSTADQFMGVIVLQAEVFSQIIRTSQKFGAPLLGLVKSVYYLLLTKCEWWVLSVNWPQG